MRQTRLHILYAPRRNIRQTKSLAEAASRIFIAASAVFGCIAPYGCERSYILNAHYNARRKRRRERTTTASRILLLRAFVFGCIALYGCERSFASDERRILARSASIAFALFAHMRGGEKKREMRKNGKEEKENAVLDVSFMLSMKLPA